MSREVRRVPLGYKHPTRPDPYRPGATYFVGLMDDYSERLREWYEDGSALRCRRGHTWDFRVEYHLTGYQGRGDTEPTVHPFSTWTDDGWTEVPVDVRDEDHLQELLLAAHADERPDPSGYMPGFEGDDLGWCLYETVSEGTPITPIFPTAEDLIDHLATVGTTWGGPMRRAAAETLARQGHSFGSFAVVGGTAYHSADDADRLADALGGAS